ncbi:MAG: HTTM domain-containing protein [Myxococcota bacterium]
MGADGLRRRDGLGGRALPLEGLGGEVLPRDRDAFSLLWLWLFGFTYIFLLERAHYLNHLYLACLPAHRAFSLDAHWGRVGGVDSMPAWILWLLRAQMGFVYFFGGVAKLNGDWLRGQPMLMWMESRSDRGELGPWLAWDPTAFFLSYGGLLFDLLIVPALLWRRTRAAALVAAFAFHATNATLFRIGIFPYMAMGLTLLFLEPGTLRMLLVRFGRWRPPRGRVDPPRAMAGLFVLHLVVQTALPLRHHLFPGPAAWTEEGHLFAWRMKLRSKRGRVRYRIRSSTGRVWVENPRDHLSR